MIRRITAEVAAAITLALGFVLFFQAPATSPDLPARHTQPATFSTDYSGQIAPLEVGGTEPASVYGWHWTGTVTVYDGTDHPEWKVAEAVAEWSARTGLDAVMTTDALDPDIYVLDVGWLDAPGALGLAYLPATSGGVVTGKCKVELVDWASTYPDTAEHVAIHELGHCFGLSHDTVDRRTVMAPSVTLGEGYARPQSADIRNIKTLY